MLGYSLVIPIPSQMESRFVQPGRDISPPTPPCQVDTDHTDDFTALPGLIAEIASSSQAEAN